MTEHARIRFHDSNLELFFEGEWCGWFTSWRNDHQKNMRFRAFRGRVARALDGMDVDLTEYPR